MKRSAKELPMTVHLGEEHLMQQGNGFKAGQEVEVVAKVSKSGDPTLRQGDLQGIQSKIMVKLGVNSAEIEINRTNKLETGVTNG